MAEQPAVAADIRDGAKPGHKERDRTARADVSYTEATRETTLERAAERVLAEYVKKGLRPEVLIAIRDNVFGIGGPDFGGAGPEP